MPHACVIRRWALDVFYLDNPRAFPYESLRTTGSRPQLCLREESPDTTRQRTMENPREFFAKAKDDRQCRRKQTAGRKLGKGEKAG